MCFFILFWALLCHCQNSYWYEILWLVWQRMWCQRDEQRMGQLQDHPSFPLWTSLPLPLLLGRPQGSATEQSIAVRLRAALMLFWTPSHSFILVRILLMQLSFASSDLAQLVYRRLWKIKPASTFVFSRMLPLNKRGGRYFLKHLVSEIKKGLFFITSEENIIILCFSTTLSLFVKQYLLQNLVSEKIFILIQSPSTLLVQGRFLPTKGFFCLPWLCLSLNPLLSIV